MEDPARGFELVDRLRGGDPHLSNRLESDLILAVSADDPREGFLMSVDRYRHDGTSKYFLRETARVFSENLGPDASAEAFVNLDTELQPIAFSSWIGVAARQNVEWAGRTLGAFLESDTQIPESASLTGMVANRWVAIDPSGAENWAASLPPGSLREEALKPVLMHVVAMESTESGVAAIRRWQLTPQEAENLSHHLRRVFPATDTTDTP